jgi:hypothetical protein
MDQHIMPNHQPTNDRLSWFQSFASLEWYEETIRFLFNFVSKTSELLLAAGIVVSTANFLTDGEILRGNKIVSEAWAWSQAIAIDSSLGIVFLNGFHALREREKIKALIFFTLTALLASVAGLITHFDALGHATGLPLTDKTISGIIPVWIMTALRAVAVIGFLLTSRLKHFSFNQLRRDLSQEPSPPEPSLEAPTPLSPINYQALASALVVATRQEETSLGTRIVAEEMQKAFPDRGTPLPSGNPPPSSLEQPSLIPGTDRLRQQPNQKWERTNDEDHQRTNESREDGSMKVETFGSLREPKPTRNVSARASNRSLYQGNPADERLLAAYQLLLTENRKITGEVLSKSAGVRKQKALTWLLHHQKPMTDGDE